MKYCIILLFILFFNCSKWNKSSIKESYGEIFGSTYFINYESKNNYQISFDSIFNEINYSVNTYDKNSLLSKWNNSSGKKIKINKHLKELFLQSKKLYELSNGVFDPTVSLLVDFYGFGSKKKSNNPTSHQIDSILQFIGMQKIKLKNNQLIKINPNIQMDFNSIAPGYTADLIGEFLESKKNTNYLVNIGGEIRARGKKNKNIWKVGIENPKQKISEIKAIEKINLINHSLATSGSYRKFRIDKNGNKISHNINPKNGKADVSNLLSVTVITKKASHADGLATIGMVLGLKKSKEFYIKNKIPAFLIYEENKKLKTEFIGDFTKFFIK